MLFGLLIKGSFTGDVKDFTAKPDPNPVKGHEWRLFRRDPSPAFDPTIEKLSDETITIFPTEIVASQIVLTLTQTELDGVDEVKVRNAILSIGFILTELANVLIAKGVIAPADFKTVTRQEYQTLQSIVSRLRP